MNATISIERAYKKDAEALSCLHAKCFTKPWSAEGFGALMENANALAFFAARRAASQSFDAFILARVASDEAEILTLGTLTAARRAGLARALVFASATEARVLGAKQMFLEVAVNNHAAYSLYSGIGFLAAGKRAGYYCDDADVSDAMVLRADLPLVQ
jgi:ribosomal-protein-alanine N-acetyltransferase